MDWKVIHVRIKDEPPLNKTSVVLKDNQGRLLETEIQGDTSTSKSTGTAIANLTSGIIQADQFTIKIDFTIPEVVSRNVNDTLFIRLFDEMYREEKEGLKVTFVADNLANFTFKVPVPQQMDQNYVELVK